MVESGANLKEAQTLMRHSTPQLTMNTYARARADRLHSVAEAVQEMVNSKLACATGVQRKTGEQTGESITSSDDKTLRPKNNGGGGGNRTPVP